MSKPMPVSTPSKAQKRLPKSESRFGRADSQYKIKRRIRMNIAVANGHARSAYFGEEHELLRAQIRRFVDEEIKPRALQWEQDGMVPRDVLRRMGELGFLGIRYPAEYGGSEMDTLATAVLAEELGRSTFSGVAITVLVHTDMASGHLYNAGSPAVK